MEKHARKRSDNILSSSALYMFIKKEGNLTLTIYKIEMMCLILCCPMGFKVILCVQFLSMPDRHKSSNYEPKFFGMWS